MPRKQRAHLTGWALIDRWRGAIWNHHLEDNSSRAPRQDSLSESTPHPAAADLDQLREDGAVCLAAALGYLRLGWSVLPLCNSHHVGVGKQHGVACGMPGKVPVVRWKEYQDRLPTETEVKDWWRQNPLCNVGVALGPVSGLIRVDVDGPGGEARLQELSGGDLPPTLAFTSGRANGGRGLLYAIPAGVTLRTTHDAHRKKEELRFQAKGAQTVLPPSRHGCDERYAWLPGRAPGQVAAAPAPPWLVEQLREGGKSSNGRHDRKRAEPLADGEMIEHGRRDTFLTSLAGTMRRRGMIEEAIFAALAVMDESCCDPPLGEAQVRKIARSVAGYPPTDSALEQLARHGRLSPCHGHGFIRFELDLRGGALR